MRSLDYDPAPLVLGLVLGPVMERSLLQALTIARGDLGGLWGSPLAAGMLLAAIVTLALSALAGHAGRRRLGAGPPGA
jgi:putative tricarboxylic transport membrane protein